MRMMYSVFKFTRFIQSETLTIKYQRSRIVKDIKQGKLFGSWELPRQEPVNEGNDSCIQ